MNGIRMKFVLGLITLLMALLTGCASSLTGSQDELPTSSDQTEIQKRSALRLQLATGYYERGQYKVALDEIKQALAIDPNNADAYCVRAMIYMEMKENRLAEDNFQQALRLSPRNPDINNNYGWFLCQNGREKDSISYFETALRSRSYQSPWKAFNNAGVCSLKMSQEDAALENFSKAFQLDPANPLTNAYLAKIYLDRTDRERARFYLNRVNKADYVSADVLLVAIKVARKLGDRATELSLVTQLRRRHSDSPEYSAYQREALND